MYARPLVLLLTSLVVPLLAASPACCQDVIGWRGDGSGQFLNVKPPQQWSKDRQVVWVAELPGRGYGSPIGWCRSSGSGSSALR